MLRTGHSLIGAGLPVVSRTIWIRKQVMIMFCRSIGNLAVPILLYRSSQYTILDRYLACQGFRLAWMDFWLDIFLREILPEDGNDIIEPKISISVESRSSPCDPIKMEHPLSWAVAEILSSLRLTYSRPVWVERLLEQSTMSQI